MNLTMFTVICAIAKASYLFHAVWQRLLLTDIHITSGHFNCHREKDSAVIRNYKL